MDLLVATGGGPARPGTVPDQRGKTMLSVEPADRDGPGGESLYQVTDENGNAVYYGSRQDCHAYVRARREQELPAPDRQDDRGY